MARSRKNTETEAPLDTSATALAEAIQSEAATTGDAALAMKALSETIQSATATQKGTRNHLGLVEGVTYHLKEDGKVDWRKMIDPKYLTLRKEQKEEIEKVYGKPFNELTPNDVDDRYLLLLLDGVKELAKLRGYSSVRYSTLSASKDFVSVLCEITWMPNFETSDEWITFTDGADASSSNTFDWYAKYLTTAAINRAFVRCVRNFLGIYIVGKDEIGPDNRSSEEASQEEVGVNGFGPHSMLKDLLAKRGRNLEQLKKYLLSQGGFSEEEMSEWTQIEDIPKAKVFGIVGLIKKIAETSKS